MKYITLLFLIFFISYSSFAQSFEELCKERVTAGETSGIAVAIYENGKTTFYSFGVADVASQTAVTPKTLFEIGSVTKTFTCSILSQLVLKNELALEDPAQKYLPTTISLPDKDGKQITLLHLATARSGLPRMPGNFAPANPANPYIDYSEKELTEFLNNYELAREPGSQYDYSNLGMGMLGYILARHKNLSYSQLVNQMIFSPLGMHQTFIGGDQKSNQLASGYVDKTEATPWTWNEKSVLTGAGGIVSNAEDMITYLIAQMTDTKLPLTAAFKQAHQERADAGKSNTQIGLGWHITDKNYVWHNGGTGGFRSFAGFDPAKKRAIIIMVNAINSADDLGMYWLNNSYPLKDIQKSITIPAAVLKEYEGVYEIVPTFKITITAEGESLMLQATGQQKITMYASEPDKFFLKIVPAKIDFGRNSEGKIEKLTLFQNGAKMDGKKVVN